MVVVREIDYFIELRRYDKFACGIDKTIFAVLSDQCYTFGETACIFKHGGDYHPTFLIYKSPFVVQ